MTQRPTRVRKSPLREAAAALSAEAAQTAEPEAMPVVEDQTRPAMRPTVREEDPRTRAARRAAGHDFGVALVRGEDVGEPLAVIRELR